MLPAGSLNAQSRAAYGMSVGSWMTSTPWASIWANVSSTFGVARTIPAKTPFAIISAIAFTTVLGTVSGLILAAAGAVVHDIMKNYMHIKLTDSESVRVAKITSVIVGAAAIVLGILFKELNVGALVGWAFSIAASANLPSLIMLLFWKRTTREGIISGVVVGMVTSLAWILLSGPTLDGVFGFKGHAGYVPFSEPGIVTIPLGFLTVIGVSLMTPPHVESATEPAADE